MKKALLVFGGWGGHEPKETSEIIAEALGGRGFDVRLSDTLDVLLDKEQLADMDLIVPNWTMGEISGPQVGALLEAVRGGVGIGGWHGGMGDAFRTQSEYQFMVGGQFVSHPDGIRDYTVHITKPEDPIVAGLDDFHARSEQYYMHVDPSNDVLATTTFQTQSAPWVNGTVMPVVWKRMYGAGRVFYSSLGHCAADFMIPELKEIQLRGLLWASR